MVDGRGALTGAGLHISLGNPTVIGCTFSFNSGGGGLCNDMSNPLVKNCSFISNYTGMINVFRSNPTVINCTFSLNNGSAMYNISSSPQVIDCIFINNSSASDGGGVYNRSGSPVFTGCSFIQNTAFFKQSGVPPYYIFGNGGAVLNTTMSIVTFKNCIFNGNNADEKGAAICNLLGDVTIENCIFAANVSKMGAALSNNTANNNDLSTSRIINSILWDKRNEIYNEKSSNVTVKYDDIQGGQSSIYDPEGKVIWGTGNIDIDPLFADPNNGDYHLKSQAGRFDPITQSWIQDDITSPCIDAGDPNNPIGYEPFPNGGIINMGAYGGTAEASKSYFGKPLCETIVAGDINGDCKVDLADLEILMLHWLEDATSSNP
jgi:hypothetical protein